MPAGVVILPEAARARGSHNSHSLLLKHTILSNAFKVLKFISKKLGQKIFDFTAVFAAMVMQTKLPKPL